MSAAQTPPSYSPKHHPPPPSPLTPPSPHQQVLTHGFVLDERGTKMSKSLGNVVDPRIVINGGKDAKKDPPYGADVLRLWVASVDYSTDVMVRGFWGCRQGAERAHTHQTPASYPQPLKPGLLPMFFRMSTSFSLCLQIGPGILKQVAESYRKLRGTLR